MLALFKELCIMLEVCIVIFVEVKVYSCIAGFFRDSSGRLAALLP